MISATVSVQGKVRELEIGKAKEQFDKNPYMYKIYPTEESRSAIRVFQMYEGSGEWFNLSKKPVERAEFRLGGRKVIREGILSRTSALAISCATPNVRRGVLIS